MFERSLRWAKRTHPTKSLNWIRRRYFSIEFANGNKSWKHLRDKKHGSKLLEISSIKIQRHVMVKGTHSPDNPELGDYWRTRKSKEIKALPKGKRTLATRQQGKCSMCGNWLLNDEELHTHHKAPRSEGGSNKYDNLELVHLYCHQQIHSKKV
jgi:RNA-directed DNA polymerase